MQLGAGLTNQFKQVASFQSDIISGALYISVLISWFKTKGTTIDGMSVNNHRSMGIHEHQTKHLSPQGRCEHAPSGVYDTDN